MCPLVFRLSALEYLSYGLLHVLLSEVWWQYLKSKIKCEYAFVHRPFDSGFGLFLTSDRHSLHEVTGVLRQIRHPDVPWKDTQAQQSIRE